MPIAGLHDLLVKELHDAYSAEEQLVKALPKMIDMATDQKLVDALVEHLEATRTHIERLDQIHAELGVTHDKKTVCKGIQGIIAESEKTLKEIEDAETRDAAIIAGAQKTEHYEISVYGTAVQFAREMGHENIADLFEDTLSEEKEADAQLSKIAQGGLFTSGINERAAESLNDDMG